MLLISFVCYTIYYYYSLPARRRSCYVSMSTIQNGQSFTHTHTHTHIIRVRKCFLNFQFWNTLEVIVSTGCGCAVTIYARVCTVWEREYVPKRYVLYEYDSTTVRKIVVTTFFFVRVYARTFNDCCTLRVSIWFALRLTDSNNDWK